MQALTGFSAQLIERHGNATFVVFTVLSVFAVAGIGFLSVENRFIDYFKASTEIHQGMELIDRKLGGTTPLDVIVDAPADFASDPDQDADSDGQGSFTDAPYMDDIDASSGGITATSYWFNSYRLDKVADIHASLDQLAATGKVISIDTTMRLLRQLDDKNQLDDFFLSILYKKLPDRIKAQLLEPYLSEDGNQLRFAVRVFESDPTLDRDRLLADIRQRLTQEQGLDPLQLHLSGMLVLHGAGVGGGSLGYATVLMEPSDETGSRRNARLFRSAIYPAFAIGLPAAGDRGGDCRYAHPYLIRRRPRQY